jgi:hypothetical protein
MLACVDGGRLYLYSGGSWAETRPAGDANKAWNAYSVSGDGTKMLAGVYGGRIYVYTAAGWTHKIHGIAASSMAKVHGVPKANIAKIHGV